MFKFKRNFSLRDSPNESSRVLDVSPSPIKRIRLSTGLIGQRNLFQTTITRSVSSETTRLESPLRPAARIVSSTPNEDVKADTPPPTPKFEPKIRTLECERDQLLEKNAALKASIEQKLGKIEKITTTTLQLKMRFYEVEDLMEIANQSQNQVRDLLNQIYNPGNEAAQKAETLFNQLKISHKKKFESLSFQINHHLESAEESIHRNMKRLSHEKELHLRTILALEEKEAEEHLRTEQEKKVVEEEAPLEPVNLVEQQTATEELKFSVEQGGDAHVEISDDCVIIDDDGLANPVIADPNADHSLQSEDTELSASLASEEQTDIDDTKEEGEERSFTPCQAQKPDV